MHSYVKNGNKVSSTGTLMISSLFLTHGELEIYPKSEMEEI